MYTVEQTAELLARLVEDDQQVPMKELGRNTVDTLNRLKAINLKADLESIVRQLTAARQKAVAAGHPRWDAVLAVVDGYLYEHCLDPYKGEVTIARQPLGLGPLGCLIDLEGNTVGLIDRRLHALMKGGLETPKFNLLTEILDATKPEDVQKAIDQLHRHSGEPPMAHTASWPAVALWGGIAFGFWVTTKNVVTSEIMWRTGYQDVKNNQQNLDNLRQRRAREQYGVDYN